MKKKVLFLSGTRADYGKIKPLMKALDADPSFDVYIFVCGMHLLEKFGGTYREILKDNYQNVYIAYGISTSNSMSQNLASTIQYLTGYVESIKPDAIVVHGDRMDALAGAIVGALNNTIVAHIEGGELSGTIDESIRHAISKFAHIHFVCTEEAKKRVMQLGEEESRIFVIGSPDIDIMMGDNVPPLLECMKRYDIPFDNYAILMYHPVTTEYEAIGSKIRAVVDAVIESQKNYIVIYPNNDLGSEIILQEYKRFKPKQNIKVFPSLRFEYFLSFLKHAEFILGNSSAGIREAGIYGIPTIDIGTRQSGRYSTSVSKNIQHTSENKHEILSAIYETPNYRAKTCIFGKGNSTRLFLNIIRSNQFWNVKIQKKFIDCDL